jgi:hypothetical protein
LFFETLEQGGATTSGFTLVSAFVSCFVVAPGEPVAT